MQALSQLSYGPFPETIVQVVRERPGVKGRVLYVAEGAWSSVKRALPARKARGHLPIVGTGTVENNA
jgi:hypothetical protein